MPDAEVTMALGRLTARLADLESRVGDRLDRIEKLQHEIRAHQLTDTDRQKVEILEARSRHDEVTSPIDVS